jgi:hypothetical protein
MSLTLNRTTLNITNKIIEEFRKIHGNKYDYSKFIYGDIIITCYEHGDFKTTLIKHLHNIGCFKCFHKEEYLKKFKNIYGDTYDYSKVIYENENKNIIITCSKHGDFITTPLKHLKDGCPTCLEEEEEEKTKKNNLDKTIICICSEHGEITIKPEEYLNNGCSKCFTMEKKLKKIRKDLYINNMAEMMCSYRHSFLISKEEYIEKLKHGSPLFPEMLENIDDKGKIIARILINNFHQQILLEPITDN